MTNSPEHPLFSRLQGAVGKRFTLVEELHGGGMSSVFLADDNSLGRRVVIKVLSRELAGPDAVDRFRREIALLASLQHPQIIPILEADELDGLPYFVMPFVDGVSLRSRLARGPLSVRETVSTLVDVSRALVFAHGKGVVHRDIKPENILMTQSSAVVADFGISKVMATISRSTLPPVQSSGERGITIEGTSLGTPAYMAPEQIVGDPNTDERADVYALGIVAYEMLVGATPFGAAESHKVLAAHMTQPVPPISKRRDDVPDGLVRLTMHCLEKDPAQRPRNASAVLRALQNPDLLIDAPKPAAHRRRPDGAMSPLARMWSGLASFIQTDMRSAARSLGRAPTLALSAVLCLTLGIGVTAAIASAIDRALLQPLPFRDPARLVTVYRVTPHANMSPFSAPNYKDMAGTTRGLESYAAVAQGSSLVTLSDQAVQASSYRVTGNFFEMLGVRALEGRLIAPSDDDASQNRVVVVSEEFWRKYLGGNTNVLSHPIQIDGQATTIIGIVPAGFRVPHRTSVLTADMWLPMRFTQAELADRGSNYLRTLGRLARGATIESAQQDLVRIYAGLGKVYPEQRDESARVVPLQADNVSAVRTPLLLMFGAVLMVLMIAASNVASLLLARGVQRQREMSVRIAIGASRWDVMRPVLAESLIIAGLGGAMGLGVAVAGVRTIGALAIVRMPQLAGLAVDWRIITFALLLSIVVAGACGAIPAIRATRVDPQDAMRGGRGGGAGRAHQRVLGTLVVGEVALSLVLLIGAGLTLKGFATLLRSKPGFDPAPILSMDVRVSPQSYPGATSITRFLEPALDAVTHDPAVDAAGAITVLPYDNWGNNFGIRYEGEPAGIALKRSAVEYRVVTPGFFDVTRQRLTSGRMLRASDDGTRGAPEAVLVNDALVKRDFAGQEVIGKRFYWGTDTTFATIVGVVSDIKNAGPIAPPQPEVYESYREGGSGSSGFEVVVRVKNGDPLAASKGVLAAIRSVDPGAGIARVRPMTVVISDSVGQPRFLFSLISVFAGVALVLAVAGLYGVMSYVLAQRTRELGIRTALGSTPARTVGLVLRRGGMLIVTGIAIGFAASSAVTSFMRSMLYGVSPLDTTTWVFAASAMMLAGLAAVLIPSLRAARVSPVEALRGE